MNRRRWTRFFTHATENTTTEVDPEKLWIPTSIVAFRCPGCGLDEVFDMDTEECWTLDGSDYGDEGSTA